jgi:hypothetical protein
MSAAQVSCWAKHCWHVNSAVFPLYCRPTYCNVRVRLTAYRHSVPSCNLGASTSQNRLGLFRPVTGQLYNFSLTNLCYINNLTEHISYMFQLLEAIFRLWVTRIKYGGLSFYDDPLLRPLSSRSEHSRLLVHRCRNSSVLSLLSALPALFRCARVSSYSILVQFFFKLTVIFPLMTSI